jgi:fatty acid kinase
MATLVIGPDEALGDEVCRHLSTRHPTIEVTRYSGGADGILLQVGVE